MRIPKRRWHQHHRALQRMGILSALTRQVLCSRLLGYAREMTSKYTTVLQATALGGTSTHLIDTRGRQGISL